MDMEARSIVAHLGEDRMREDSQAFSLESTLKLGADMTTEVAR